MAVARLRRAGAIRSAAGLASVADMRQHGIMPGDEAQHVSLFESADWYDRGVNWEARLRRELPVLREVFGPPASGGLLDAGCGPCRQGIALAQAGYRVTGADASKEMLALAGRHAADANVQLTLVRAAYGELAYAVGGGFDGVYCIGNSLAAAGDSEVVAAAVQNFARVLRAGGKLFVQVLNFPKMRAASPCVRGPRVSRFEGTEYVSSRVFHIEADRADVTNLTLWRGDGGWQQHVSSGVLYPMAPTELTDWCHGSGLTVDALFGSYAREPFDVGQSDDLIVVATRRGTKTG